MSQQPESGAGSVSKVECVASVRGRGLAKVALYRHLAPVTLNALLRVLPLDSRVNVQPGMVCLFTEIRVGVEKPRTRFAKGDAAFLPSAGLLCIFLREATSDRPLNPLGNVEDGLPVLEGVRPGEVVSLSLAGSAKPPQAGAQK